MINNKALLYITGNYSQCPVINYNGKGHLKKEKECLYEDNQVTLRHSRLVQHCKPTLKVKVKSCPTLSDPINCSPPGSSVHGIFQATVLEWGAIAFSETNCTSIKKKKLKKVFPRYNS